MPLPGRHDNLDPFPQHRLEPRPQLPNRIRQDLVLAPDDQTLVQHPVQPDPPIPRRAQRLVVRVPLAPAEEVGAPPLAQRDADNVLLRILPHARPIVGEIDPGRQQDRRPEFHGAAVEFQRVDFRVRVQEMRQQAHGQVGAGGVAGEDDVVG